MPSKTIGSLATYSPYISARRISAVLIETKNVQAFINFLPWEQCLFQLGRSLLSEGNNTCMLPCHLIPPRNQGDIRVWKRCGEQPLLCSPPSLEKAWRSGKKGQLQIECCTDPSPQKISPGNECLFKTFVSQYFFRSNTFITLFTYLTCLKYPNLAEAKLCRSFVL